MKRFLSVVALSLATASGVWSQVTFQSGPGRTHLMELFTSEGCSSCPPAERWMSQLLQDPRLWRDFVPVVFHVDYWDQLGWRDRFATKAHTARQRKYSATWGTATIYTPGFVLDGQEWKARSLEALVSTDGDAGLLTATFERGKPLVVTFQAPHAGRWDAQVVILGFGMSSDVVAGENRGRKLLHDFVALSSATKALAMQGQIGRAEFDLADRLPSGDLGLAVWVTKANDLRPVQAVGGKLP